jgi:phosphoenolpyruvate synthase/pyruvate phosphate dikinase
MGWAEPFRKLRVRANADIPRDAMQAKAFGAEGIGLCRTEHMFFAEDRIEHMRAMILATNEKDRRTALKKLLPMQRADFIGVFKAMDGLPVTIRTIDPPLHEFLPEQYAPRCAHRFNPYFGRWSIRWAGDIEVDVRPPGPRGAPHRVASPHCWGPALSEPDVTVSRHPAQALRTPRTRGRGGDTGRHWQ